jgi:short chain dehydrogenase
VLQLTKLPVMRKQKGGHIFQVSSVGGRYAIPGNTPYRAAKWAVGGFSDSLAIEVAPFGVKVCTLEPGGIRTNWARRAAQNAPDLLPEYEASVRALIFRTLAENPTWGAPRIHGELLKLGFDVSNSLSCNPSAARLKFSPSMVFPIEKSAYHLKPKNSRRTQRNPFHVGNNDLANYKDFREAKISSGASVSTHPAAA